VVSYPCPYLAIVKMEHDASAICFFVLESRESMFSLSSSVFAEEKHLIDCECFPSEHLCISGFPDLLAYESNEGREFLGWDMGWRGDGME